MLALILRNKGQITLDAILAVMFLLLVSAFIYYNVFDTVNHLKDAEIVDRAYVIADVFENYALTAYSKDVTIKAVFQPMGVKNYTIYIANKTIIVNNAVNITFTPVYGENGIYINVSGDSVIYSPNNIPSKVINVSFGDFYVIRNMSIDVR